KSPEALVRTMIEWENFDENELGLRLLSVPCPYDFLKLALENDAPFLSSDDFYLLGVRRDRSGLSQNQKHKIAYQATAQVLWSLLRDTPTATSMCDYLLTDQLPLQDLIGCKFSEDTVLDWLSEVNPDPRKGRPSKKSPREFKGDAIVPIPGIFTKEDVVIINFPKLIFTLKCLTKVLNLLNVPFYKIFTSKCIKFYRNHLQFYPQVYTIDWLHEALEENRAVFT
ncbi:hypothetical protein, partial [Anaplasma marginale]|uniref:hypothetical protein n=1 Tax=Anaplasma marginale TaxID=770 RepID=UPI0019D6C434